MHVVSEPARILLRNGAVLVCLLLISQTGFGQCTGNLGDNIFTEGDFGSGIANILPNDPGIAPGYTYTTQVPPNDGQYTISNDMTQWPSAWDWLLVADNSPDPNGYMMIVNASYEPGLFYEQEVDGLCGNTLYEFSADIFNVNSPGSSEILPNVSFLIDGQVVYSTGNIPETGTWNTYGFTFTTSPGQTTVTLALQNNAPGGIGNDLILDNISFRPCGPEAFILPEEIANICEDGQPLVLEATIVGDVYDDPQIQWQESFNAGVTWQDIPGQTGLTYTHTNLTSGFYYYRYLLANGTDNLQNAFCRVVSNTKVVYVLPKFVNLVDTLCSGLSYTFGTEEISQTGTYTDSLTNFLGCDSIVTLDLNIQPDTDIAANLSLSDPSCAGFTDGFIQLDTILNGAPPYFIELDNLPLGIGSTQTGLEAGTYPLLITDRFGCRLDSLLALNDPPPLLLNLGPDQSVDLGEPVTIPVITSLPLSNYEWTPAEVDCFDACTSVSWFPQRSGLLYLVGRNAAGCEATDSVYVEVREIRQVYIPNVFSPNNDGINDRFYIFGKEPNVLRVEELQVFDRWGGLVFSASDLPPNSPDRGWDGTVGGQIAPIGVYTYLARVRFLDGLVFPYTGSITLLR